jgi:lysozyme
VWTQAYADQRFCDSLGERVTAVLEVCTVAPNENQLSALVSLAYNIGMGWKGKVKPKGAKGGLRQSTVLRQHNLGNFDAAANAFTLWNKVNGEVERGLTIRRKMEAALYVTPPHGSPPAPMPQVVDAESKMTQSPINRTSAVIVGAGATVGIDPIIKAIDAAKGVADSASTLKEPLATVKSIMTDTLGIQPDWILPLVLIGGGLYIMHWRKRQRDEGRA